MQGDASTRLAAIVEWLQKEFSGIRTGQANPGLLDTVRVEAYGSLLPLQQVGSVSIEDARTLRISLWDASLLRSLEKGMEVADLGVSVVADSSGVRVVFPELTSERRVQLQKLAKSKLEEARVSVRGVRDEVLKDLERRQKEGELSEDEKFAEKESVQKHVDECNRTLESLFTRKEAELTR